MSQLVLHDGAAGGLFDHVVGQRGGVVDARAQHGGGGVFARLHDADDLHVLAVVHQVAHVVGVVRLVFPHVELVVVHVVVRGLHQLERDAQDVVVGGLLDVVGRGHLFFGRELLNHVVELVGVAQTQRVQHEIADVAVACEHEHHLVVVLGPVSCFHVVLALVQVRVAGHLVEHVGAHRHGHEAVRGCR